MIKAVVFDMDGLLFDTEKLYHRFWLEAAAHYGYPMKDEHAKMMVSLAAEVAAPLLQKEVCADFDYYKVRDYRRKIMKEYTDTHGVEEKKGLEPLLEFLHKNHIRTAIASSSGVERIKRYLEGANRLADFEVIISSSMVAYGKPEPDIYLEAARRLGLSPGECVALEDSPNGIMAASRAGYCPIMVPDMIQPNEEVRKILYACVPDLEAVIPVLKELLPV